VSQFLAISNLLGADGFNFKSGKDHVPFQTVVREKQYNKQSICLLWDIDERKNTYVCEHEPCLNVETRRARVFFWWTNKYKEVSRDFLAYKR